MSWGLECVSKKHFYKQILCPILQIFSASVSNVLRNLHVICVLVPQIWGVLVPGDLCEMRQTKYSHEDGDCHGKRLEMDIDYMCVQKERCSTWKIFQRRICPAEDWLQSKKQLYSLLLSTFPRLSVQNRINVECFVVSRYTWNVTLSFSTSLSLSASLWEQYSPHVLFSVLWLMV